MTKQVRLKAPPHIDHWSTALVWLVTESCDDDKDQKFVLAYRPIMRCHPLYERFMAASAMSEGELCGMLVDKAQGSVHAARELQELPACTVQITGLQANIAADLVAYGLRLLPTHFEVSL